MNKEMMKQMDCGLLGAVAWKDVEALCRKGMEQGCAAVCVPPCYVKKVKEQFPQLTLSTVIGYPMGYQTQAAKSAEAWDARQNGADELELAVNLCDVKSGELGEVVAEIGAIRQLAPDRVLKVIVPMAGLSKEEKIALCYCVARGGADYISADGASVEDVKLFKELMGERLKIKAMNSGSEKPEALLAAGCERVGVSPDALQ